MSYPTLTQQEYRNLKTRLTRALNSGDHRRVIAECDRALALFDEKGYPDDWHRWQIAHADATLRLEYATRR